MSNKEYLQGNFGLWEDDEPRRPISSSKSSSAFAEVTKPTIPLSLDSKEVSARIETEEANFVLSRRWEQCVAQAAKRDNYLSLLNIIRPVTAAQDQLIEYLKLMRTTKEGALWVFFGYSGSGKTTFLSSLEHQFNRNTQILEVVVLKADDLNLPERSVLRTQLVEKIQRRHSKDIVLVLVLEDREDSIDDSELGSFVQTLKGILRTPDTGENVLVVFPVNNAKNGKRIIQAAEDVGIQQHEGSRNTIFTFEGPESPLYVDIVEDLAVVLNGRPLSSFGVSRTTLDGMPKDRITVGNFIQEVAERIQSQEKRMNRLLKRAQYKEIVTIFVFVRPMEPPELFTNTQQIVVDSYNRINPNWLLTDGSELNIRQWKDTPERFASIVNGVLHARVVDFPPHVLYQIIQIYGSDELKGGLTKMIESKGQDATPTKNQANSRQAVDATNLARLLRGEPVTRPKKVTIDDDSGTEDIKLSDSSAQKRNLIRKGIYTAEWIPTLDSVNHVHGSIARAFKDLIDRGNLRLRIRGYVGTWAEGTLMVQGPTGTMRTVKPDITIETIDTLYLLEFSFGGQQRLTRADLANYILRKLNDYHQQLPLLSQVSSPS
jgi:energy-coupling factor transporter ATP-binding protein EcfA2